MAKQTVKTKAKAKGKAQVRGLGEAQAGVTGSESEGGITSSYASNDGVVLKVPYSFMGSIYDEAEQKAALARHEAGLADDGPAGDGLPAGVRQGPRRQARLCSLQLHGRHAPVYAAF